MFGNKVKIPTTVVTMLSTKTNVSFTDFQRCNFSYCSLTRIMVKVVKQGRIHGNPVADGWAAAVMRKPLGIQKCDGRTDGPTYRPTDTARYRVECPRLKNSEYA